MRSTSPLAQNNESFLKKIIDNHETSRDISIIGPIPSIISKRRGNYRHHLIIQTSSKVILNKYLKWIISTISPWEETKKVKWHFDIDPIEYN